MEFGDLIKYFRPGYTHWALYTGKNKSGQDTVVEFTGESGSNSKAGATVREGLLQPGGEVDNRLDSKFTPKSEAEMRATMKEILSKGAGPYGLLSNNCEHLVTSIRYGTPKSLQAENFISSNVKLHANVTNEIAGTFGAPFYPPPPN
ncbi:phospholipase A and acyltransferase 1-like [Triplophysa rosa]|uniref:Phospholipid-metabolizing enzyme A-C1-like n=1 Tax=Triplophysa rosa TaxID=992332 RepID=A0A9W7WZ60_TRIRA|nr:phospholipase A and acyltransferase 1-like [Triplophysa rosa]KAI7811457.1 putative phospholipid-metabolizing enzyme A-C1-like [Triplophysa rosa]